MSWAKMMEEFTIKNGYKVPRGASMFHITPEIQALRLHLMLEELGELSRAMNEGKTVKFADAICDLLYVVVGTAVAGGIGPILEDLFEEVHRSNMTKNPSNIPGHRGALKGPGFEPPDLASIIDGYNDALKIVEESL